LAEGGRTGNCVEAHLKALYGETGGPIVTLARQSSNGNRMYYIWIIIIGFIAGLIARWTSPAPNNPQGFILTCILGIIGAFVATWLGQALGWYRPDQGAGLIGAIVGAVIVLFIYHLIAGKGYADGPGGPGPRRWL
jgi:uncharacterized membrane protein YeaQ/YmgE (transglycosylase-associated protein family)